MLVHEKSSMIACLLDKCTVGVATILLRHPRYDVLATVTH